MAVLMGRTSRVGPNLTWAHDRNSKMRLIARCGAHHAISQPFVPFLNGRMTVTLPLIRHHFQKHIRHVINPDNPLLSEGIRGMTSSY